MSGPVPTKAPKDKGAGQAERHLKEQLSRPQLSSPHADVLALQHSAGNRAVNQLLQSTTNNTSTPMRAVLLQRNCACGGTPGLDSECAEYSRKRLTGQTRSLIQTKLRANQPGDRFEQEADLVADMVMGMPEPNPINQTALAGLGIGQRIQRGCPECEEEIHRQAFDEEEVTFQAKEVPGEIPEVTTDMQAKINTMRGGGQPLPESVRTFFEPRFGFDFSHVRVHTDTKADILNWTLHARAFTTGENIFFRQGEYNPGGSGGRDLLAHELTHVVQQRRPWAPPRPLLQRHADPPPAEGAGAPRRVILLDANVIDQINRGNQQAADTLRRLIGSADVYISRQAYNELVRDPAIPRLATANRLVLKELGIRIAPAGEMARRVEVLSRNATASVLSEKDVRTAAQAAAVRAEVWSFDRGFRRNRQAVEVRLGVRIAPESVSVPLVGSGGVAARQDYRVARQLLSLPPVTISLNGRVTRPPPATGGSTGGGAPSSAPMGPGQPAPAGGSSRTVGSETRATIGVPEMRRVQVGGPSARGTAVGGGIQLAFQGANFVLNWINDEVQARRVQAALSRIEAGIAARRRETPELGVLLVFYYTQVEAPPESLIRPGARFEGIETATGRTQDEARDAWRQQPQLRPHRGRRATASVQEVWIPPLRPTQVAALGTPFERTGRQGIFAVNRGVLQNVKWGGVLGFDNERQRRLDLPEAPIPRFLVLRPPREIRWYHGYVRTSSVPVVQRPTRLGETVEAVDLNPWLPWDVTAVPVFPYDDFTDGLFRTAPATRDNLNQLRLYVNIQRVRWVRPENIVLLGRG